MKNLKNIIPKLIFKKTINLNQSYKKEKKSTKRKQRERHTTHSFCVKKYGLNENNDIKFIQNKMGRKIIKYKKEKLTKE